MTSETGVSDCVVLLRNLGNGMLHEIVAAAVGRLPDVVAHGERLPDGVEADLVIEPGAVDRVDITGSAGTPKLVVSGDGRGLLAVPIEQVSESSIGVAVSSVVAVRRVTPS